MWLLIHALDACFWPQMVMFPVCLLAGCHGNTAWQKRAEILLITGCHGNLIWRPAWLLGGVLQGTLGPMSQRAYEIRIENLVKFIIAFILILIMQSGHKFAHVTTAQLPWHVQKCDLIWLLCWSKINMNFGKIWIMSSWTLCEMGPWEEFYQLFSGPQPKYC